MCVSIDCRALIQGVCTLEKDYIKMTRKSRTECIWKLWNLLK